MNPFDEHILSNELNGIGSDIKKVGRKIDHARRKVAYEAGPGVEKTHAEVKRFLGTDLGKIVAVIVVVVATVYGLGPVVLEGLKAIVIKGAAFVKQTIVACAKYVAKQGAKKLIIKEIKSQAISYAAKEAGKLYANRKIRKAQKAAVQERLRIAEEERLMEEKIYKEMEAEFLKESGMTVDEVDKLQSQSNVKGPTGKIIPRGFISKLNPPTGEPQRGTQAHYSWSMNKLRPYHMAYDKELAEWKRKNPKVSTSELMAAANAIPKIGGDLIRADNSPEKIEVQNKLVKSGVHPSQVKKMWENSDTYKAVRKDAIINGVSPIIKNRLISRGVDPTLAENAAIVEGAKMGERLESNNFLIIGGLAALLLTM